MYHLVHYPHNIKDIGPLGVVWCMRYEAKHTYLRGLKGIIYGMLSAVVADNLANHQIGGFKSGFGKGFRKCRTCLGIDGKIQSNFSDSQFVKRLARDHNEQCAALLNLDLSKHYSWLYGLHNTSILNELQFFTWLVDYPQT